MSYENIPYKSFCWVFGTTSFRTKNFNQRIELQLALLDEFWTLPENQGVNWKGNSNLQSKYYNFMQDKGFLQGNAPNKPKDAREITSGLVDIGLIYNDRHLTPAGRSLLNISQSGDFSSDNGFQIAKDSYIYLKQMLKTSNDIDGSVVRPFVVLLYLLSKVDYLTMDEYTYLLPLCTNEQMTNSIPDRIKAVRNDTLSIDDVVLDKIMLMENYRNALRLLLDNTVDEELICTIGINRKSRTYDKPYYPLYKALKAVFLNNERDKISTIYRVTKDIKIGKYWRRLLFNTSSKRAIENSSTEHLNMTEFSSVNNENQLKTVFFKKMHLFKAKATLSDYLDLNRRYIKNTDIVLFEDNTVKLDIVPKQFFNSIINDLYKTAFTSSDLLSVDCPLIDIDPCLVINEQAVMNGINEELGTAVTTMGEVRQVIEDERYSRLQHLIDTKFTDVNLLRLLELFEERNDDVINAMVTDNADIPTIFEYVLGIIWYKASDRKGKILDYLKLSLEADLLPKTHAAGGEADIVYEYEATGIYPEHSLLLEATLTNPINQRRMEMEPVSRHLGQHLIRTGNLNSYCVFVTNNLNINVISDFRNRKTTPYYDNQDYTRSVDGMKIIPIKTTELKLIVRNNIPYTTMYLLFEEAFNSTLPIHNWYNETIVDAIRIATTTQR